MFESFKKFIILVFIVCFSLSLFTTNFCLAEGIVPKDHKADGSYELNDFVQVAIKFSARSLQMVGSLALLMFIYGGFVLLISSGNSEKVTLGKQVIIGAVIGLAIVFTSYMIITFVLTTLGVPGANNWATQGGIWGGK